MSARMGEGRHGTARQNFSFFMRLSVLISPALCVVGIRFREPILYVRGGGAGFYPLCEAYAIPLFLLASFAMVGIVAQIFFVAAANRGWAFR